MTYLQSVSCEQRGSVYLGEINVPRRRDSFRSECPTWQKLPKSYNMLNVGQTIVWRLSDLDTYLSFCYCVGLP